ncbi:rhodanese-like domain-containing protein [Deinococcus misasensis]|uniref:rhodanese-like domain-containing protein n=1 Tax=Deinococcus misasensis TaxID=392413 RepID=UPI00054E9E9E|nr:rhodanese-like domain-containing protein [Deinococcus misasensis]
MLNISFSRGLVAGLPLFLVACSAGTATVQNVSVQDLQKAHQQGSFILDVRTPEEYNEGHVKGSILLPLNELSNRLHELPHEGDIYVVCRSGNRSRQASELLVQEGFQNVYNVEGGMQAWQAAGFQIVRR